MRLPFVLVSVLDFYVAKVMTSMYVSICLFILHVFIRAFNLSIYFYNFFFYYLFLCIFHILTLFTQYPISIPPENIRKPLVF